ncbi:MAG: response regulator [Burkholderiaceae bacterium]
MALILVAEDDSGTRRLLSVVLERSGHEVLQAQDGNEAWSLLRSRQPDVVVSDINMPGMSGLDLLSQVRADPATALTPFVLLTSMQERRDMRRAMSAGADDYISKPFMADELLDAIRAQVNRHAVRAAIGDLQVREAVDHALQAQAQQLGDDYELKLAHALSEQWPGQAQGQRQRACTEASVLCVRLEPVRAWAIRIEPGELAHLLRRFHECVGDSVYLFGALGLQGAGERLEAVFEDPPENTSAPHLLRALRAAFALRQAEATLASFAQRLVPARMKLPPLAIRVGLHLGPVALTSLEGLLGGTSQAHAVGLPVLEARDLAEAAVALERRVMVSVPVMRRITGAVRLQDRQLLTLPGREGPLDACTVEPAH